MVEISVRKANELDFDFFYAIKCEEDNIYWSGHTHSPEKNNLRDFFYAHIKNKDVYSKRTIFVVEEEQKGETVGYVYFDPIDNSSGEISIGIMEQYSGQGFGRTSVCKVCNLVKTLGLKNIYAKVREDNVRSLKMFGNAGFKNTDEFEFQYIPNLDKNMKMIKLRRDM